MKVFVRHRLCGFIGIHNTSYTIEERFPDWIGVYWFTNGNHANLFTSGAIKQIPNVYFWTHKKDILKIYNQFKLPRKLKKKVNRYIIKG